ncbi:YajG family lipoprotein [Rodentibacter caecimuris]|uniref:Lipoprotein n=1 Tax=Rodentibacter caecimuris TaxID=1796644 RepID=A0ABX3L0P4_9PAST|nr:hypothetical protein BKG89_00960 [Rodentibacter heylii]
MNAIEKFKQLSGISLVVTTIFLSGCQTPSNSLNFTPIVPNASMNINQTAVVYVMTNDNRNQAEIASYTKSKELIKLTSSPSPSQLFQQIMQQNLISKGFRIGQVNNSNTGITVNIKQFYAKVGQGNLRYSIESQIQVEVVVQGTKGQFTKNFNASRTQSGAFSANNDEIHKVLGETLKDITTSIYQDQEISAAIAQYSN